MEIGRWTRLAAAFALMACCPAAAFAQGGDFEQADRLYRQGEYARALERVDAHLAALPRDARGRFLKGMILTAQKQPQAAMKIYAALTQDYPELPEPYNNLAVLYAAQGDYDMARSALEMAVRADPAYAAAHENLGDIYAKMALQRYQRAAELDRGGGTVLRKLRIATELVAVPPAR